ncbi:hypothetical protein BH09BAC6_BH09BAC6_08380 [soil metagenome]|jgi:hypothetical protein
MKLKLLFSALLLVSLSGFAQDATKVFDEVKNVTVKNIGAITKNKVIKGYFNFYEYDKIDRKTRIYKINLMDENLNQIGIKEITGPKDLELVGSGYDGNSFCFKFWNKKEKTVELKTYDQDANERTSSSVEIKMDSKYLTFQQSVDPDINILENNGFVDYSFYESNDAFIISYINGDTKKSWQQAYQPEGKSKLMIPAFMTGNNEMILTAVSRIEKGLYNFKTHHSVIANSTKDGRQLFELTTEFGDNFVMPVNAVFEGDKILIVGLNYKSEKSFTTSPDGLAFLELDKNGKLLKSNFKTFEESLGKYLPMEDHKLQGNYSLYLHDIVRTNHNTNLVIAEKFKKELGVGGAASLAFSALTRSTGAAINLQLENMVVIEYDKDGNVIQAQEIPKAKGSTGKFPDAMSFLSPYHLATAARLMGWMDYMYTLKNEDNSEITFSFVDREKLEENAKKTANFGQIKYKNGKISIDKVPIANEKATFSHLLPAKVNHVLQVNYYKKDKKLSMSLIKLNN